MSASKYPLYIVEWDDSGSSQGWGTIGRNRNEPLKCISTGWLIASSDKAVTLVSHLAADGNDAPHIGHTEFTIPRAAVTSMRRLPTKRTRTTRR